MLSFLAVAIVVVVTPGPDFALVTRNVLAGGRVAGFATLAGLLTGVSFHVGAAVVGVSAVLATSATVFTVLKLAGGAYLVVLGVSAIRDARRSRHAPAEEPVPEAPPVPARRSELVTWWRQGFLSNALNPKVALFFVTFVPQFVEPGPGAAARTFALSTLFVAMAATWTAGYVLLLGRARRFLGRPTVRRRLEAVSGAALAAVGGRLLLASS